MAAVCNLCGAKTRGLLPHMRRVHPQVDLAPYRRSTQTKKESTGHSRSRLQRRIDATERSNEELRRGSKPSEGNVPHARDYADHGEPASFCRACGGNGCNHCRGTGRNGE
jgi:hypothetical protein